MKKLLIAFALACFAALGTQAQTTVTGTFLPASGQTPQAAGLEVTQQIAGTNVCGHLDFVPYNAAAGKRWAILWNGNTYLPQSVRGYVRCSDGKLINSSGSLGVNVVPNTDAQPGGTLTWMSGGLSASADGSVRATSWSEAKAIPDQSSVDWGTLPVASIVDVGYQTIESQGVALNQRTTINFTGGQTCSDNAASNRTDCQPTGLSNPMNTLGDWLYGGVSGAPTRLAGNTTSTREFLISQGSGGLATAPFLGVLQSSDIPNNGASTTGQSGTTLAFASVPTPCGSNQFSTAIAANGNAICAGVNFNQLVGSIADGQLPGDIVRTNASATFGANVYDFSLATEIAPKYADPGSPNPAQFWVNGAAFKYRDNAGTPATHVVEVQDNKGIANGYASLNSSAQIPASEVPAPTISTLGGVEAIGATAHEFVTLLDASGILHQAQPAFTDISGVASAAQLPTPTLSTLGGVEAINAVSHEWFSSISTAGVPALSQPSFSDLLGQISAAQLIAPTATTLGGIESIVSVSHEWIDSISTAGVPHQSQPSFTDLAGTLSATQCPNPSASTVGCVESLAATSHQWINAISTGGVPSSSQPAFADISGTIATGQLPAVVVLTSASATFGANTYDFTTATEIAPKYLDPSSPTTGQFWINGANLKYRDNAGIPGTHIVEVQDNKNVANGYAGLNGSTQLLASEIPPPGATTLGGVEAVGSTAHEWVTFIDTTGIAHQAQPAFTDISGIASSAQIPTPTLSTLGGIEAINAVSHEWISSISTSGIPALSQPAFSDLSGQIAAAQLIAPTISTLGGVESVTCTSAQFLNAINTSGIPQCATVAYSGLSGLPTLPANTGAVSHEFFTAYNSTAGAFTQAQPAFTDISGVASAAQIPNPSATTLGGVESIAAVSHEWVDSISTSGVPHLSQPSYSDISGVPTLFYQTVDYNGTAQTQRPSINFIPGANVTLTFVDNAGLNRTDVTVVATGGTSTPCTTTNGSIQYDNSGAFGCEPDLVFNGTHTLTLGASGVLTLAAGATLNGLIGAMLPNPSASSLGGIESFAAVSHQWINSISTSGVPAASQPSFSDISGVAAASQLPNPSASTLGGIESIAATSHQWIDSISTSGVPHQSQPAYSDISGTPTLFYQTLAVAGTAQTQRPTVNWISGSNATVSCVDNLGATRTDCTVSASTSASVVWSQLSNPIGNLSLAMGSDTTLFTYGAATGSGVNLFEITDTASNTGTGALFRSTTASGSTAIPAEFDSNGNGVKVTSAGLLTKIGTGGIDATALTNLASAGIVLNNQANTYTTGLQNLASATFELPSIPGYAPTAAGIFGYDSTNNRAVLGNGTNTSIIPWVIASPASGDYAVWSGTLGALADGGPVLSIQTTATPNSTQSVLNFINSTSNPIGLTVTPSNPSGGSEKFEIGGTISAAAVPNVQSGNQYSLPAYVLSGIQPIVGPSSITVSSDLMSLTIPGGLTVGGPLTIGSPGFAAQFDGSLQPSGCTSPGAGIGRFFLADAVTGFPLYAFNSNACQPFAIQNYAASFPEINIGNVAESFTVGTGGVTINTLVQTDSSNPLKVVASTSGVLGIALSTASSGGTVEVARYGQATCVADNTFTAGDIAIIGSSTVVDCKDSGQTASSAIGITTRIVGLILNSGSAGGNMSVELTPAHFGTQVAFSNLTGSATCAQLPAFTGGDTTSSAGSCNLATAKINGGAAPTSSNLGGWNSSGQPVNEESDLGTITYNASGTTTFAAGSVFVAGGVVTATHSTSTTFSPTGLLKWGSYLVEIKQDTTGGGVTFTLGTGGTCSGWKVGVAGSGFSGSTITLQTAANAIDVLTFTYDGTNCLATFN